MGNFLIRDLNGIAIAHEATDRFIDELTQHLRPEWRASLLLFGRTLKRYQTEQFQADEINYGTIKTFAVIASVASAIGAAVASAIWR
jgi:hypothetical protein